MAQRMAARSCRDARQAKVVPLSTLERGGYSWMWHWLCHVFIILGARVVAFSGVFGVR